MSWKQEPLPSAFARVWKEEAPGTPLPRAFRKGPLTALVGREPVGPERLDFRWHISLSASGRVPSWEELSAAAHELRPGVAFAVGVPPQSWWINVHRHTLHLWELRDEALLEQWLGERMGMERT